MADQGSESKSKEERAESVERQLEGTPAPEESPTKSPAPPEPAPGADGVGESTTRRAEDIGKTESEPGRVDTGTDGTPAQRPTGTSTPRDTTGVDPQSDTGVGDQGKGGDGA